MIRKNIVRLLLYIFIVSVIVSGVQVSAATAVPSSYDKWGTSALGPGFPSTVANYYKITKLCETKKENKKFTFTVISNEVKTNLYVTFPSIGGFRIFSDDSGYYEPDGIQKIRYKTETDGSIRMSAQDGTTVIFEKSGETFSLKVFNSEEKQLFRITSDQIAFGYSRGKLAKIKFEMPLSEKESIYGTGERFNELEQVGKRLLMWNVDCGYHGAANAEFWRGYKNIPLLYSNRGYTLFYNSFYSASIDIGYTDSNKYTMDFGGPEFDIYFWTGTPRDNLQAYTKLTGVTLLLPKWAYQYSAGAGSGVWGSSIYGKAVEVAENYSELGTPDIAAVYIEGIGDKDAKVYNVFNKTGTRVMKWNSPDYSVATVQSALPGYSSGKLPFVKKSDSPSQNSGTFLDFADPLATKALKNILKSEISWGLVGGLLDFGELVQAKTIFRSLNKTGYEMHNFFPYWYAKAYNTAMRESLGNDEFVFFSRSGCAGSQKYTAFFTGDQMATFGGLKLQLIGGLTESACGFTMWGGDLAGYSGLPTNEVFARGMQFAAFQPIMRSHGNMTRFPWDFGAVGKSVYKTHYWLRENLLNKIYSSAVSSSKTGLPMTETLTMAYPYDERYNGVYSTYLFCDDFLVTPVLTANDYTHNVTFPDGTWYSLWDGSVNSEAGLKTVEAPINYSPVYIKAGSTIPVTVSESLKLTDSMQDRERVEALLVTVPDKNRTSTYWKNSESEVLYASTIINDNTFRVSCGKNNDTKALILKGVAAYSVYVDGKPLKRLSEKPSVLKSVGFYSENDNETLIYLGDSDWSNVDISLGKMNVRNLMNDVSYNDDNLKYTTDGDWTSSFAFASSDEEAIYKFKKAETINNIVLKWTYAYPEKYTVYISNDGVSWEKVYSQTDGIGGINSIDLDGKTAGFVKLTGVESGTNVNAMLYEIEAYEKTFDIIKADNSIETENPGNGTIATGPGVAVTEDQIVFIPGKKDQYIKYTTTYVYFPTWAIVLICVGGALLIAGAVWFFIVRRRKKKSKS